MIWHLCIYLCVCEANDLLGETIELTFCMILL